MSEPTTARMTPEALAAIREEAGVSQTCDDYRGEPWGASYCLACEQYKLRHSLKRLLTALDQLEAEHAQLLEALKVLADDNNYGSGRQFVLHWEVSKFASDALAAGGSRP